MKLFVSVDIEGITGLVSWSQCSRPDGKSFDYAFARRMMTHDVVAAIEGARRICVESGESLEVLIKDSHGNSKNLLIGDFPSWPDVRLNLLSGNTSGEDGMMEGVGGGFDAAVLVGYHAMAGTLNGVMEHTITGGIHRVWLNGRETGEIGFAMAVAGRHGVPVVAISSDAAGCREALDWQPKVAWTAVKEGLNRYCANLKHPDQTSAEIADTVECGLSRRASMSPLVISGECALRVEFNRAEEADQVARLVGFSRVDGYTVETVRPSFAETHVALWNLVGESFIGRDLQG